MKAQPNSITSYGDQHTADMEEQPIMLDGDVPNGALIFPFTPPTGDMDYTSIVAPQTSYEDAAVPEPTSAIILIIGVIILVIFRKWRDQHDETED